VLRTSLHSFSDLRIIRDMASSTPASGTLSDIVLTKPLLCSADERHEDWLLVMHLHSSDVGVTINICLQYVCIRYCDVLERHLLNAGNDSEGTYCECNQELGPVVPACNCFELV